MLTAEIRAIHREHRGRYGSPRIRRELRTRGTRVARKRVARLMREEGLRARQKRRLRRTTDSSKTQRIAPNRLQRNFVAQAPNRVWVGDVTYVPVAGTWLYLAVLLDLFSRRVLGWATSERIDTQLVLAALEMAVNHRQPSEGLIHHTDCDCRYASDGYLDALRPTHMIASMSRKADCWDNAVAECFFATLEKELLDENDYLTREQARASIDTYIEFYYNDRRLHSTLDYVSPLSMKCMPPKR